VWVYDLARSQAMLIFESRSERIVYMVWTPDGNHLSFLLGEPRGLSLVLAEVKESTPVESSPRDAAVFRLGRARRGCVAYAGARFGSNRAGFADEPDADEPEHVKGAVEGRTPFKTPPGRRRQASRVHRELPRRIQHRVADAEPVIRVPS